MVQKSWLWNYFLISRSNGKWICMGRCVDFVLNTLKFSEQIIGVVEMGCFQELL